jgi:hypothetical protein
MHVQYRFLKNHTKCSAQMLPLSLNIHYCKIGALLLPATEHLCTPNTMQGKMKKKKKTISVPPPRTISGLGQYGRTLRRIVYY